MELDELKNSWNKLNERLDKSNIVDETSVERLILEHKKLAEKSQYGLLLNSSISLIAGIVLLLIMIISLTVSMLPVNGITIYFMAALAAACIWDSYTYRYLRKTDLLNMPTKTVVKRITRYYQFFIRESYAGAAFFLSIIALIGYRDDLIHKSWQQQTLFCLLWIITGGVTVWIIKKAFHKKIVNIKKNLADLQELKET